MKIKKDLRKILIAASAASVAVTGSLFLVLFMGTGIGSDSSEVQEGAADGSFVVTHDNMGSYGELMFAYIGENNYLYNLDDESKPLIEQPASYLLYASDDTVIYTAAAETDASHEGRETIIQELQIGENENSLYTIDTVSIEPCWSSNDEVVYYVNSSSPRTLYTFEPLTSTSEAAAEFDEDITALRISSDGLLVTTESGIERLYVPLSKQLTEAYYDCSGARVMVCEQYDLILTVEGELYYRWIGAEDAVKIAEHVTAAQGYQDNEVLYTAKTENGLVFNGYFISDEENKELTTLGDNMLPQITVSADYAFLIDDNNIVYRYTLDGGEYIPYYIVEDDIKNPMISVFDYRLMIYDLSREQDKTFVKAMPADKESDTDELLQVQDRAEKIKAEERKYPEYTTLQMGSIGSDVSALQSKLISLGYMNGVPTGIFDIKTTIAVTKLQSRMGMDESGIATRELESIILSDSAEAESELPVKSDDKGIYVRDLQARLITLGYLKHGVSGKMDEYTKNAVSDFASDNHAEYSGKDISTELADLIFDNSAAPNTSRLELQKGDCAPGVTELNSQLKKLGYLAGSVNPSYDDKTEAAIKLFEEVSGMEQDGIASRAVLDKLFADDAVKCPEQKAPADISDSASANETQVISDRQLKVIRKWLTKQFAVNHTDKQAVKRLQKQLVRLGYMNNADVSMIYDSNTSVAVEAFQKENELPADGLATKNTLTKIFDAVINIS